jgi:hypothetical protein
MMVSADPARKPRHRRRIIVRRPACVMGVRLATPISCCGSPQFFHAHD